MAVRESVKALAALGFTNLEAEIYAFLLQESPATGYRIAQAIGKPAANTYKAIQTLEQKGAVIVDGGASRMCRAISADELLARIAREFESKRESAKQSLSGLANPSSDDRIYQFRSREQVLQRAREMLAEAKQVALVLATGPFVSELTEDLAKAAEREVAVAVLTNQPIKVEKVEVVEDDPVARAKPSLQVVVDADQTLVAIFDDDGQISNAIWTRNPMMAVSHHQGLAAEICVASVKERLKDGDGAKRISKVVWSMHAAGATSGFAKLRT